MSSRSLCGEMDGVHEFALTNSHGVELRCISLGASITSLRLPNGTDVVLGYKDIQDYRTNAPYIGCTVGRVANRIRSACFSLDGCEYQLTANVHPHHLHGGKEGFNKVNWSVETVGKNSVTLRHISPAGSEGYPGEVTADTTYTLTDENEVHITYTATTNLPTIVNLTNHSYFNLSGKGTVHNHLLTIYGDRYTVLDKELIATGVVEPVAGTALDFLSPHRIGERMKEVGRGYDINYCLDNVSLRHPTLTSLRKCATLCDPDSGTELSVFTNQLGVQLYTGNFLDDSSYKGRDGELIVRHAGVCLETQAWPNAANNTAIADQVILRPGQRYENQTVWSLSWKK